MEHIGILIGVILLLRFAAIPAFDYVLGARDAESKKAGKGRTVRAGLLVLIAIAAGMAPDHGFVWDCVAIVFFVGAMVTLVMDPRKDR